MSPTKTLDPGSAIYALALYLPALLDGMSPRQLNVLAARSAGVTWAAIAATHGVSTGAVRKVNTRGTHRLLANFRRAHGQSIDAALCRLQGKEPAAAAMVREMLAARSDRRTAGV